MAPGGNATIRRALPANFLQPPAAGRLGQDSCCRGDGGTQALLGMQGAPALGLAQGLHAARCPGPRLRPQGEPASQAGVRVAGVRGGAGYTALVTRHRCTVAAGGRYRGHDTGFSQMDAEERLRNLRKDAGRYLRCSADCSGRGGSIASPAPGPPASHALPSRLDLRWGLKHNI